jgi:hypothetical protein
MAKKPKLVAKDGVIYYISECLLFAEWDDRPSTVCVRFTQSVIDSAMAYRKTFQAMEESGLHPYSIESFNYCIGLVDPSAGTPSAELRAAMYPSSNLQDFLELGDDNEVVEDMDSFRDTSYGLEVPCMAVTALGVEFNFSIDGARGEIDTITWEEIEAIAKALSTTINS